MKYIAGVDVGGTNIVCGLLDEHGNVLSKKKYPTKPERGPSSILEGIANTIRKLRVERNIPEEDLAVIGMGLPGLVDPKTGTSIRTVNLGWENINVSAVLQKLTGKPVFIDNDVRMYVYGEAMAGAGRNHKFVLGLTIGTGLASAFVQNGELLYGHQFMAGEIGHVPIDSIDYMCNCGRRGCLETIVSATGIIRQALSKMENGEKSLLQKRFPTLSDIRSADVTQACHEGDQLSQEVLEQTGRALGYALSWMVPILSPDVIMIGGGGALAGDPLLKPMELELKGRLLQNYQNQFVVKSAELNDDAGVVGSALWALHQHNLRRN